MNRNNDDDEMIIIVNSSEMQACHYCRRCILGAMIVIVIFGVTISHMYLRHFVIRITADARMQIASDHNQFDDNNPNEYHGIMKEEDDNSNSNIPGTGILEEEEEEMNDLILIESAKIENDSNSVDINITLDDSLSPTLANSSSSNQSFHFETGNDTMTEIKQQQPKLGPNITNSKVAWLLSFPNSGAAYTLSNTEKISGSNTGTNYYDALSLKQQQPAVPIDTKSTNGPFFRRTDLSFPEYVLTETHCTGYCYDCSPNDYVIPSLAHFKEGCITTSIIDHNGTRIDGQYTSVKVLPSKIVYLLRNPFDNIVTKMHVDIQRQPYFRNFDQHEQYAFLSSRAGFESWCEHMDTKYDKEINETHVISNDIKDMFHKIPCYADWFRYIQWHNYAILLVNELERPLHVLYYEGYDINHMKAVHELFEFLELPYLNAPMEFIPRPSYHNYYTDEEIRSIMKLAQTLASPICWNMIHHYFDKWSG